MPHLVVKLAGFWVAKKVILFGAIKMYGPGRLYRRTLSWNRYLLGSFPPLKRGGAKGLGFMFRLPDRLLGKGKSTGAPAAAAAMGRQAEVSRAMASKEAVHQQSSAPRSVMSQSGSVLSGFSAGPLVKSAREARNRMYKNLPSKESIRSTIIRGGQRATSLLKMPTQQRAALMSSSTTGHADLVMSELRRIRRIYLQSHPGMHCGYM